MYSMLLLAAGFETKNIEKCQIISKDECNIERESFDVKDHVLKKNEFMAFYGICVNLFRL